MSGNRSTSGGIEEDNLGARRGRRARKQVHPSLSEDMMAAMFGGGENDCDEGSGEDEDGFGGGGGTSSAGGEAPLRFRKGPDAPWGNGDKPLVKVSGEGSGGGVGGLIVVWTGDLDCQWTNAAVGIVH